MDVDIRQALRSTAFTVAGRVVAALHGRRWSTLADLSTSALNMYALYLVGPIVERIYGWRLFGLMYVAVRGRPGRRPASSSAPGRPVGGRLGRDIRAVRGACSRRPRIHEPVLDRAVARCSSPGRDAHRDQPGPRLRVQQRRRQHRQRRPHRWAASPGCGSGSCWCRATSGRSATCGRRRPARRRASLPSRSIGGCYAREPRRPRLLIAIAVPWDRAGARSTRVRPSRGRHVRRRAAATAGTPPGRLAFILGGTWRHG